MCTSVHTRNHLSDDEGFPHLLQKMIYLSPICFASSRCLGGLPLGIQLYEGRLTRKIVRFIESYTLLCDTA